MNWLKEIELPVLDPFVLVMGDNEIPNSESDASFVEISANKVEKAPILESTKATADVKKTEMLNMETEGTQREHSMSASLCPEAEVEQTKKKKLRWKKMVNNDLWQ